MREIRTVTTAAPPAEELIDFGTPATSDDLPDLEQRYQAQMRQIITQKIELPVSTLLGMIKDQINLNPEFQRRGRWDVVRQSRFIESLIMNVPVPPVFLGEDEYGKYVVLDGRQRLTAIAEFLRNSYKLRKLKIWSDFNKFNFNDLVKRDFDKYLLRRFIPAVIILKESSSEVKYDVFDRLNTGGVEANEMEIRNAIYRGEFTDNIVVMSEQTEFRNLWSIPLEKIQRETNSTYQKMEDLEILLRFFALSEYESMDMKFKDYLSVFMGSRNKKYKSSPELASQDRVRFSSAAKNAWKIFGANAFKKPLPDGGWSNRSVPLADAVMIGLADYDPVTITGERAEAVRRALESLLNDSEFRASISAGTNGKAAIARRVEAARKAFAAALA